MTARGRLRDGAALAVLAVWAVPFFWQALTSLKESGELADIEQQWLSQVVDVPVLQ